ncbi:MAG: FMN-binding protein [Actinomycetota bacterium]|nr:FMN-binding protein [Actinomycetota bacterium]
MKRVALSITATVLGLVALLSFKSSGHPLSAAGALPSAGLPAASSSPAAKGSTTTSAPPKPGTGSAAGGSTRASSTSAPATRTIAGSAVQTQYGVVQVQVTVTGTKIDNVSFLQLTAYDGRSQQINSDAAPILLQETIAAQNANINTVSGASYTSAGYVQSLQSALDQAGIR